MRAVTADSLRLYLCERLRVEFDDLQPDTALFSSGLLDSFSMADLVSHIESREGIAIPPDDFTLDNLDSIAQIIAYLDARTDPPRADDT